LTTTHFLSQQHFIDSRATPSQIIIFFSENHFRTFFERNTQAQRWVLIKSKSLSKEWNLALPTGFSERGYREERKDEDGFHKSQIWFIGQLD